MMRKLLLFLVVLSAVKAGNRTNINGYDLWVTSDSGCTTQLNMERETDNVVTGDINYWVKVGTVNGNSAGSSTLIYICYGKSSITTDQTNASAVWDSSYKLVLHFADPTTLTLTDSTAGNTCTNHSATATNGVVGGAASFVSGGSQYIDCGSGLNITGSAITVEAFMNFSGALGSFQRVVSNLQSPTFNGYEILKHDSTTTANGLYGQVATGGSVTAACQTSGISSPSGIDQLVLEYGTTASHFVFWGNGVQCSALTKGANLIGSSSANLNIGRWSGAASGYWDGWIDEVRISNVDRGPDWINTTYHTISDPGTFLTIGSEGAGSNGFTYQRTVTINKSQVSACGGTPACTGGNLSNFPIRLQAALASSGVTTSSSGPGSFAYVQ